MREPCSAYRLRHTHRRLARSITLWLCLVAGHGGAHGLIRTNLAGKPLCLDTHSIRTSIRDPKPALDQIRARTVTQQLQRTIPQTLARYHVPFAWKRSCQGSDAYLYTLFLAAWANHESRPLLFFTASLQVGRWPAPASDNGTGLLAGRRFDVSEANLLFQSDFTSPYYAALPAANETMARQLALAWLNDDVPVRARHERTTLIVLGAAFDILVIASVLRLWRRRKARTARADLGTQPTTPSSP